MNRLAVGLATMGRGSSSLAPIRDIHDTATAASPTGCKARTLSSPMALDDSSPHADALKFCRPGRQHQDASESRLPGHRDHLGESHHSRATSTPPACGVSGRRSKPTGAYTQTQTGLARRQMLTPSAGLVTDRTESGCLARPLPFAVRRGGGCHDDADHAPAAAFGGELSMANMIGRESDMRPRMACSGFLPFNLRSAARIVRAAAEAAMDARSARVGAIG